MDYYKDLKKADHVEHIRPGLAVGFTFEQIDQQGFINLCLKWGLNKVDIIEIVVPNAGYIFPVPVEYSQRQTSRGQNKESIRKKLQSLWTALKERLETMTL